MIKLLSFSRYSVDVANICNSSTNVFQFIINIFWSNINLTSFILHIFIIWITNTHVSFEDKCGQYVLFKKEIHLFINIHEISIFTFRKHILKIFSSTSFFFFLLKIAWRGNYHDSICISYILSLCIILNLSNLYKIILIYMRLEFNSKIKKKKRENTIRCYSRIPWNLP